MDNKDKKIIINGISAILILLFITILVMGLLSADTDEFNIWLEQSITNLKVYELIIIIVISNMLFSGK